MKTLLIDVDSKIPNLALMKISTWKKSLGYEVGFNIDDPDEVYASCIFPKNKHKTDGLRYFYPDAKIDIGGTGIDLQKKLPDFVDLLPPDYSLYPDMDYDLGFTTRGCIRNCYFCVVPKKEGKFRIVQHPKEFHDPNHKKVVLMDNNILVDKEWFMEVTDWILDNRLKLDLNQGVDVRLIDDDIAARLTELKPVNYWRIAFDTLGVEKAVVEGIQRCKDAGMNVKNKMMCYVYVNGNEDFENALHRCNVLREMNVCPYVMFNQNVQFEPRVKVLRRWSIPYVFFKTDYETYLAERIKENKVY